MASATGLRALEIAFGIIREIVRAAIVAEEPVQLTVKNAAGRDASGFTECWTIVNVDRTDFEKAKRESPSTDRFYRISDLIDQNSEPYLDFRDRIQALTGTQRRCVSA